MNEIDEFAVGPSEYAILDSIGEEYFVGGSVGRQYKNAALAIVMNR